MREQRLQRHARLSSPSFGWLCGIVKGGTKALLRISESVTGGFGIVTDDFGNVTGHFGDVTDGPSSVS